MMTYGKILKIIYISLFGLILTGCSLKTVITPTIQPTRAASSTKTLIPTFTITPTIIISSSTPIARAPTFTSEEIISTSTLIPTPMSTEIPVGWIAFAGAGSEIGVGLARIDGIEVIPISNQCIFCDSVSWSPDGHSIAFNSSTKYMGSIEIYISKLDGSDINQLTFGGKDKSDIAWSPSGEYIAYVELSPYSNNICIADANNGETQKLTYSPLAEASPAWSPDGKKIAFLRRLDGSAPEDNIWNLMIMVADGSK